MKEGDPRPSATVVPHSSSSWLKNYYRDLLHQTLAGCGCFGWKKSDPTSFFHYSSLLHGRKKLHHRIPHRRRVGYGCFGWKKRDPTSSSSPIQHSSLWHGKKHRHHLPLRQRLAGCCGCFVGGRTKSDPKSSSSSPSFLVPHSSAFRRSCRKNHHPLDQRLAGCGYRGGRES